MEDETTTDSSSGEQCRTATPGRAVEVVSEAVDEEVEQRDDSSEDGMFIDDYGHSELEAYTEKKAVEGPAQRHMQEQPAVGPVQSISTADSSAPPPPLKFKHGVLTRNMWGTLTLDLARSPEEDGEGEDSIQQEKRERGWLPKLL